MICIKYIGLLKLTRLSPQNITQVEPFQRVAGYYSNYTDHLLKRQDGAAARANSATAHKTKTILLVVVVVLFLVKKYRNMAFTAISVRMLLLLQLLQSIGTSCVCSSLR